MCTMKYFKSVNWTFDYNSLIDKETLCPLPLLPTRSVTDPETNVSILLVIPKLTQMNSLEIKTEPNLKQ